MRGLVGVLVALAVLLAACGSADDVEPTGTETSERAPREATVGQAQQQQQSQQSQQSQQIQAVQQQADPQQVGQQEQQTVDDQPAAEPSDPEPQPEAVDHSAVAPEPSIVGTHKGVRSEGRTLGLAAAPVLIEHFGDFT